MNPQQDIYNMTVNSSHKEFLIIEELILNIIKSTNQNQVTALYASRNYPSFVEFIEHISKSIFNIRHLIKESDIDRAVDFMIEYNESNKAKDDDQKFSDKLALLQFKDYYKSQLILKNDLIEGM
jgi:hypothetical protein